MRGRWRLFRHEAGRVAGPPPWVYVLLFAASQLIGHWSVANYGAVAVWLSNGVLAAALLQLHRRPALMVLGVCFGLNLLSNVVRGDPGIFLWINPVLNMGEAMLAAVLARRYCGAALDMRRPRRLVRFAGCSANAAATVSLAGFGLVWILREPPFALWLFRLQSFFVMELMGLLLVAPVLLLLARRHRFAGAGGASWPEVAGLFALMGGVTVWVFGQTNSPHLFLTLLPMLLIALRLSPTHTAAALVALCAISGIATLTGHGPVHLARLAERPELEAVEPIFRQLGVYHLYLLSMIAMVLPLSTVMTERRRLEARLRARTLAAQEARRRAEDAAAARSRFLAMMSHEMRTPLNGVAGFADLLAARTDLDPEAIRHAQQIRRSSDGLLTLVEDILEFARGDEPLTTEPMDLAFAVEEALRPSRAAACSRGLTVRVENRLPPRARFAADPRALRQALHPLMCNAVKFTAAGEVRIRLERTAGGVAIEVSDTGCGIAPEVLPQLFEAFWQGDASIRRGYSGAGLGLALANRHVRRMGGRIEVDSRPGLGSSFRVELPLQRLADAPEAAPEAASGLEPAPGPVLASRQAPEGVSVIGQALADPGAAGAGRPVVAEAEEEGRAPRVLVVDDHPVNREVARIMLEALGCEVTEACDGLEALDRLGLEAPDLVLMDVRMPRMDGLEATRRIRGLRGEASGVAIVAMTADAMPEDVERCLASGMNAHLAKPISQTALWDVVSRSLSGTLPAVRDLEAA